jgi:2-hydroxy-3-keto-5-methylthiopentenyl-1-phosphate phosphatase
MPLPPSDVKTVAAGRGRASAGYRVFIDFDNTITCGDVLDGIIEKFAIDDRWRALEASWAAGRIGARACLEGQMGVLRASWPDLARHLDGVRLDPGCATMRDLLRDERIELTVVSDNFDLFVGHILQQRGLADVAYLANHLEIADDRLLPSFPFANPDCPDCAHCKKTHFLPPHHDARQVIFIGDGRSDICPARNADIVFAKTGLLSYLQAAGIPCLAYDDLTGVVAALKKSFHENKI